MVEDNQFQNKEKNGREDRLRGGGEDEKGKRLSRSQVGDRCPI